MRPKNYSARRRPTDCWNARLLEHATYTEVWELPHFPCANEVPTDFCSFRYVSPITDDSVWIHFYGADQYLEDVWDNPEIWANQLTRFKGVISPDLSIYRDMPLSQQLYNTYRNRTLAHWFTQQGILVIPNVRWGDQRSYDFAFEGIRKNSTVCVSTMGILTDNEDRTEFSRGFDAMMEVLAPKTVLVYGSMPLDVFGKHQNGNARFIQYETATRKVHQRGGC